MIWGWDDHLYRLIGTFLDPGFTAIILVFGFLTSLAYYLKPAAPKGGFKNKYFLLISIFLFVSILFTYSRAGYIALIVGMGIYYRKQLWLIVLSFVFLAIKSYVSPQAIWGRS